jgi:hypothetical protein
MPNLNFIPIGGATTGAVPTSSNQNLTILKQRNYRCFNGSNTTVFIRLNTSDNIVAASTSADMPIAAGGVAFIDSDNNDRLSIISTGSPTGTFSATAGYGRGAV